MESPIWPCPQCRLTSRRLEDLCNRVATMESRGIAQDQELSQLNQENRQLRQTVAELTTKVTELTWKQLHTPTDNGKCALIGTSIIRDISDTKLVNTSVTVLRGGVIDDVRSHVDNISEKHSRIVLVSGGNDCDEKNANPADIIGKYRELTKCAKTKANHVTVSSICPRIKPNNAPLCGIIETVNAELQVMCDDEGVTYVDNTSSFHLADGTINDGYLLVDGVHLTRTASDRLAKNLGLNIKDGMKSVCHDNSKRKPTTQDRPAATQPRGQQTPTSDHGDIHEAHVQQQYERTDGNDLTHPFWKSARGKANKSPSLRGKDGRNKSQKPYEQCRQSVRNNSEHNVTQTNNPNQSRCYNCYESNHVVKSCTHEGPVRCFQCNEIGHKAKHHTNYD